MKKRQFFAVFSRLLKPMLTALVLCCTINIVMTQSVYALDSLVNCPEQWYSCGWKVRKPDWACLTKNGKGAYKQSNNKCSWCGIGANSYINPNLFDEGSSDYTTALQLTTFDQKYVGYACYEDSLLKCDDDTLAFAYFGYYSPYNGALGDWGDPALAENCIPYSENLSNVMAKTNINPGYYLHLNTEVLKCTQEYFFEFFGNRDSSSYNFDNFPYYNFYENKIYPALMAWDKPYVYGTGRANVACLGKNNVTYWKRPSGTAFENYIFYDDTHIGWRYHKGFSTCEKDYWAYPSTNYSICENTNAYETGAKTVITCPAGQYIPKGYRTCQPCTKIADSVNFGCAGSFDVSWNTVKDNGAPDDIYYQGGQICPTGYKWKNSTRKQCVKCLDASGAPYICENPDTSSSGGIGNPGTADPISGDPATQGFLILNCDDGTTANVTKSWDSSNVLEFPTVRTKCPATNGDYLWLCYKDGITVNSVKYRGYRTFTSGEVANPPAALDGAICLPARPIQWEIAANNTTPLPVWSVYAGKNNPYVYITAKTDDNTFWGAANVQSCRRLIDEDTLKGITVCDPTNNVYTVAETINKLKSIINPNMFFDVQTQALVGANITHNVITPTAANFKNKMTPIISPSTAIVLFPDVTVTAGPKITLTCPDNSTKEFVYPTISIDGEDLSKLLSACSTSYTGNNKQILCKATSSSSYAQLVEDQALCVFNPATPRETTSATISCNNFQCKTNLVHCEAGLYLPKYSSTCKPCPTGYWCPAGDHAGNSDEDQGKNSCDETTEHVFPTTWTVNDSATQGYGTKTACLAKVNFKGKGGTRWNSARTEKVQDITAGAKYRDSAGTVSCDVGSDHLCTSGPTGFSITDGVSTSTSWERTGYVFGGWYTTDPEGNSFDPNSRVTSSSPNKGNVTLYARWLKQCAAGYYLPANSSTCALCPAECPSGYQLLDNSGSCTECPATGCSNSVQAFYCKGGNFQINYPTNQGISRCPPGYPHTTSGGKTNENNCYIFFSFSFQDATWTRDTGNPIDNASGERMWYKADSTAFDYQSGSNNSVYHYIWPKFLSGGDYTPVKERYLFNRWLWQKDNITSSDCSSAGMTVNSSAKGCNLPSSSVCPDNYLYFDELCIPQTKLTEVPSSVDNTNPNIYPSSQRNVYAQWKYRVVYEDRENNSQQWHGGLYQTSGQPVVAKQLSETGLRQSKTNYHFGGWCINDSNCSPSRRLRPGDKLCDTEHCSTCSGDTRTCGSNDKYLAIPNPTANRIYLYTYWEHDPITCPSGQYLPKDSLTCAPCPETDSNGQGYYCLGGDFIPGTTDQGKTSCPSGYPRSHEGNSSMTTCYVDMSFFAGKNATFSTRPQPDGTPRGPEWWTDDFVNYKAENRYKQTAGYFIYVTTTEHNKNLKPELLQGGSQAPTKPGYTFAGWYRQKHGSMHDNLADSEVGDVSEADCVAGSLSRYTACDETVSSCHNRGCSPAVSGSTTCPANFTYGGGLCIPNHRLYDADPSTSEIDVLTANSLIASGSQRNFYAKWTPNSYTVTYTCDDGAGGTGTHANGTIRTDEVFYADSTTGCSKTGFAGFVWDCRYNANNNLLEDGDTYMYYSGSDSGATCVARYVDGSETQVDYQCGSAKITNTISDTATFGAPYTFKTVSEVCPSSVIATGYDYATSLSCKAGNTPISTDSTSSWDSTAPTVVCIVENTPTVYNIYYDYDGGNGTNQSTYTTTTSVKFNDPVRQNCVFDGWCLYNSSTNTGHNCTSGIIQPNLNTNSVIAISIGETGDRWAYARWKCNINYDLGGGEESVANVLSYSIPDDVVLHNPTRTGYSFVGWCKHNSSQSASGNTCSVGSSNYIAAQATPEDLVNPVKAISQYTETGPRWFYSKWNPNSYRIDYYCDANASSSSYYTIQDFGTPWAPVNNSVVECTKTGHTFNIWRCEYLEYISEEDVNTTLNPTSTYGIIVDGENEYYIDKPARCVAMWTQNEINLNWYYNTIGASSDDEGMCYFGTSDSINVPQIQTSRPGYTFTGWSINSVE